ncbi:MAG: M20 family metallopeptidase [Anaerovoracaceae bacterium]
MKDVEKINVAVEETASELKQMALYIHENPELGLEERKACQVQTQLLEKYGFSVETGLFGFETSYRAVYKGKKPGPKIAMLAEYDALPELGHGCGHNLIAMVGVGSGLAMRQIADQYGGEIYVFGTPAEETWGSKVGMAKAGAFDDMDVVMMAHPMDRETNCMNTMALKSLKFKFFGRTAHAAAAPHEGVNALDAVINFFNMVNALRQQTKEDARIHGIITDGGKAPNVIPDYTEAFVLTRANKMAYLQELTDKVIACAEGAALGTGCRMEWEKADEDFMDTDSNLTLAELYAEQMEKLGVAIEHTGSEILPGSSDIGDISYVCPAIQSTFDICEGEQVGAHTREFAACAGSDQAMEKALLCIRGFAMTAAELLRNPENLTAIKEEFNRKHHK